MKTKNILLIIYSICLCSCSQQKSSENITVAVASSIQEPIKQLCTKFTEKTGIPCETVASSSGKIAAQLSEGAPYDIFIAANMAYPQYVYESGYATSPPKAFAYGQLILWSTTKTAISIETLTAETTQRIAIANPETAPYGEAAKNLLQTLDIWDNIEKKLVYGESIGQANQFILSKSVDIGITSRSTSFAPTIKTKGAWFLPDTTLYTPLKHGIVIIKRSKDHESASRFYAFIFSEEAQKVLQDFGYLTRE